jgi:outer membrane protein TolC
MSRILLFLCLASAQAQPQLPTQTPAQIPTPEPFTQKAPTQIVPIQPGASLTISLEDAFTRARAYAQQLLSADIAARIAREDRVQARAARLPTAQWQNGFIYTQPNGTPSGVFVPNDGPHVYFNVFNAHAEPFSPALRAEHLAAIAAEAAAWAKVEIARRGLNAVVVQNYYGMVVAQRKVANASQSLEETLRMLDITDKQEKAGEAARSDVVKAQIQVDQRQRDVQEAQLALDKARVGFAVFLFPDYRQDFAVIDDLDRASALPPFPEVQTLAQQNNPDIRAAQAVVNQENFGIRSARAAFLPTLSVDYWYGLQANTYAIHNPEGLNQIGSAFQIQLNVPIWNWGATRSKVKQAEYRFQQARNDLSFAQRQLLANLNAFYAEAQVAASQLASLRHTLDLSAESLRMTLLRYQAGEVTILELVDAETTLIGARNALDDGLTRYRLALANLQTLTGVF